MSLLKVDTIRNRSNSGAPEFDLGLNVTSGISTIGGVKFDSGVITSTSNTGIVTYYGDGSGLTLIPNSALEESTISGRSLGTNLRNLTPGNYITGSSYNGGTARTFAVDATSSNTANKVVARDSSGDFTARNITATEFRKTNGTSSQFLMADGSVNSNVYATSANIGNATLTLGGGNGITLSTDPTFDANQSTNKTITISTNSSSSNIGDTLVRRNTNGGAEFGPISTGNILAVGTVTATGFIAAGTVGFLKSNGTIDTTSYLTSGSINNPQITFTTSGSGFSIGATQSITLNQSDAATISLSINSSTSNTASTLVYRDENGDFSAGNINVEDITAEDITASGISATNFDTTSDASLKTDIFKVDNALDILESINGVSFKWKRTGEKSMGIIAQEVEEVLPELINDSAYYKSVNYNGLIAVLIESIKELKKEIKELKG